MLKMGKGIRDWYERFTGWVKKYWELYFGISMINKMYMIPDIRIINPDNSHTISNLKKGKDGWFPLLLLDVHKC